MVSTSINPTGAMTGLDTAPLTPAQRDLFLHLLRHPGDTTFNVALSVLLPQRVEAGRWQRSLDAVLAGQPIFRTLFTLRDGEPIQWHSSEVMIPCEHYSQPDWGQTEIRSFVEQMLSFPMNCETGPLFKFFLLQTMAGDVAVVVASHLVMDGFSGSLIFEAAWRNYLDIPGATRLEPVIKGRFFSHAREDFSRFDAPDNAAIWRQRLGKVEPLDVKLPAPTAAQQFCRHSLELSRDHTAAVRAWCQANGCGLPAFFSGLYALLLQRYADHEADLVIRTVLASRRGPFKRTLGCFYQVVPYVFPSELWKQDGTAGGVIRHSQTLLRRLGNSRDISVLMLNSILQGETLKPYFNYQAFAENTPFEPRRITGFIGHPADEIQFLVTDLKDAIGLELYYHESTFTDPRFLERLAAVARHVTTTPGSLADVPVLLTDEHEACGLSTTEGVKEPAFVPVIVDFEHWAIRQPRAIALRMGSRECSYQDCNRLANRLSRLLASRGIRHGQAVGICLPPSLDQVIAILAIHKRGAWYLPIDPAYPEQRRQFMLRDAGARVLITTPELAKHFESNTIALVQPGLDGDPLTDLDDQNPAYDLNPDDVAYVIYTSGTTGEPKGVQVTHRNLQRLFESTASRYTFSPSDVWTLFHSIAFDFSVWEIWGALRHGGCLVVVPDETRHDPRHFLGLLSAADVTVLNQTPAAFYAVIREIERGSVPLAALRLVIFGGEALNPARLLPWFDRYGDRKPELVNMYGITETTVHVTWRTLSRQDATTGAGSMIGVAIPEWRVHVMDRAGRPVPPGWAGEIHVGGAGVTKGYLNQPELTARRFIRDPFSEDRSSRLYRSGDLARWRPGKRDLEYLGRLDLQVKIRGYRLELGEIESALLRHPEVRDVSVIALNDPADAGSKRLVAYVVARDKHIAGSALREFLIPVLPLYMVPSAFVPLDRLPLTPHGKLDRRALPDPDGADQSAPGPHDGPRNPVEQTLVALWGELLKTGRIGIHDNFFERGGHSLAATQLAGRIRDSFGCDIPLCHVFHKPTVSELAAEIARHSRRDIPPFLAAPRDRPVPLSFSQERVWFLQKMHPENRAYDFHSTLHFKGRLDRELLRQALSEIVRRHEIYRTVFVEEDGRPRQVVRAPYAADLPLVDLSSIPVETQAMGIRQAIQDRLAEPFRLDQLPLVRWLLVQLGPEEHILLHAEHHIVHDGWSFVLFLQELTGLYRAFQSGGPSPWPDPAHQFADFACWQRVWMDGPAGNEQLAYWKRKLAGAPVELMLPYDRPRPSRQSFSGHSLRLEIPVDRLRALESMAQARGSTLYMTLLAAFQALLSRYTGQEDIIVGSGIANRRLRETESLMGMLLNNVALRTDLSGNPSFEELLSRVKQVALEAYDHQDVPFDRVVEAVNPPRRPDLPPLFHVFFTSYDGTIPDLDLPGLTLTLEEGLGNDSAKFDINVIAIARSRQAVGGNAKTGAASLLLIWEYNSDLFDAATMERMAEHYVRLLEAVSGNPGRRLSDLPLMSREELEELLRVSRGRDTDYPRHACLHQLFSEQAARTPEGIALRFQGQSLSYRELDQRSNRLARRLQKRGVGPDRLVGLCLERSFDLLVGILGILKAGGAYVPLDPDYPVERVEFIRRDTRMSLVVTRRALAKRFALPADESICLDALTVELDQEEATAPDNTMTPEHLAYVIYTSGSTGTPKGVGVVHRGVVRLVMNTDYVELGPGHVLFQYATVSFDAATFEIFGALLNGLTLVIAPPRPLSLEELGNMIRTEGVTTLWLTAPLFHQMVDHGLEHLSGLKQLLAGGDVLARGHVERFLKQYPDIWLINGYGPTEGTTFTCCHGMKETGPATPTVPIGRPIANTQVYVLDTHRNPVPLGVRGELYIGGDGLARGYLNRPELTAERFVPDTVSGERGKCLYRTGDWGRYLEDGTLEFFGRLDHQVKIRGFRIELGEVEAIIRDCAGVRDVVVTCRADSPIERRLVAYVVPTDDRLITEKEIKDSLGARCPAYMVPSRCLIIPALPLTAGGKVDRAALPEPTPGQVRKKTALDSLDEWRMTEIWCEVLGEQEIDAKDNFFDRGGHSLLGLRLVARINETFGVNCPLRVLFEAPTIRGMVKWLERDRRERANPSSTPRNETRLLCLQPGRDRPPLFWVPGGGGGEHELTVYARVMRQMGDDLPFYGFLAHGVDGITRPITRVGAMAAAYIKEMKTIQPRGPYYLAGECRGGGAAFEMARQLRRSGDDVAFLALLDTPFPSSRFFRKLFLTRLRRRVDEGLHRFLYLSEGQRWRCLLREMADIPRHIGDDLGWEMTLPEPGDEQARQDYVNRVRLTIFPQTLRRYQPRPYAGDVLLVLSEQTHQAENLWKAWMRHIGGTIQVKVVPGDHRSYIRDHSPHIGKILREALEIVWTSR